MSAIGLQIENAERRWLRCAPQREKALGEIKRMADGEAVDWRAIDTASRVKRRLERLGRFDEADAIDDGPSSAFNPLERIIGASQLSGIEFMERGLVAARSVARVEIRTSAVRIEGFGSGVMISPELFMTNNHVLGDAATAAASIIQFEYLNSVAGPREPLPFPLRPDRFFVTHPDLDFTIVAVEATNAGGLAVATRGWCPLIPGSGKAIVSERVNIIQHPQGERMQVSLRDNTILAIVDDFMHYEADTLPGSSGSPVFNDQWEMAALHHAGVPKRDELGRILMTDGNRWTGRDEDADKIDWIANEGVRVSRIIDDVNSRALPPEQRKIWDGAAQPPHPLNLWDLFGGIDGARPAAPEFDEHGMARVIDESGDPAWLFRLSFGPMKRPAPLAPAPRVAAPPPPSPPSAPPAPPPSADGDDPRRAAREFFERFRSDGDYYDAEEDGRSRAEYYEGIEWDADPAALATALQARLQETHDGTISYTRARLEFLYPSIDLHEDGLLRNIYSGVAFDPVEAIARELARAQPFAEAMGVGMSATTFEALVDRDALWERVEAEAAVPFNCEHVVCQSWFDKRAPMRADLHHLFACESRCNSFRNNIPYWQFPPEDEGFMADCGRTEGSTKFEPKDGKGAVARATLYFVLRYPHEVGDSARELSRARLPLLIEWHQAFPVSEYERHRNWLIAKAQGNRNPFIDYPEAATADLLADSFGTAAAD